MIFAQQSRPSRWTHLWIALLVTSCACALYLPALATPFIFDDLPTIVDNPQVRKLWPLADAMTPAPDLSTSNRPLAALSFSVNYAWGELDVRGYHAVNLALHAVNSVLLYALLLALLRRRQVPEALREAALPLSAATTLLWSVHPLLSESVVYITQRTELMAATCYLAALLCAARAFEDPRRPIWQLLACCAATLGLGCKETSATIAFAVLGLDWLTSSASLPALLRARPVLYIGLGVQVALATLMVIAAPYKHAGVGFGDGVSALQWLATQGGVLALYLSRTVWPDPLSISYNFPIAQDLTRYWPQLSLIGLLLLATLAWTTRRSFAAFPALFCFIHLAPSSSVVPMVTEVVAERRMYLPLAALTLYAVILGRAALARLTASSRTRLMLVTTVTLVLVAGLAARTLARVADYATAEAIWQAAVALDPTNPQAALSLAMAKYAAGQPSEARRLAQPVTQWRREHSGARDWSARAHLLLGTWEERAGQLPAALAQYSAVEPTSPDRGVALLEAARVLLRLNQPQAAAERLQAAIDLGSAGASEHHNLGVALSMTGQHAAAAEHFARSFTLDPNKPDSAEALALALQAQGRPAEAASVLEEVIRRWPDNARALSRLGQVLITLDQSESALKALDRALALDTTRPETHLARCDAMARLGKVAQALRACDQAMTIAPKDPRLRGERDRIVALIAQRH